MTLIFDTSRNLHNIILLFSPIAHLYGCFASAYGVLVCVIIPVVETEPYELNSCVFLLLLDLWPKG